MRVLLFILFLLAAIATLMYFDNQKTIYDSWYRVSTEEKSLLGSNIKTIELRLSEDSSSKYFVIYDNNEKGIYCKNIDGADKISSCTLTNLKKRELSKEDLLMDVIKVSEKNDRFLAEISMANIALGNLLTINIGPLDEECLTTKKCKFEKMDRYMSFVYDIIRRMYITMDNGI